MSKLMDKIIFIWEIIKIVKIKIIKFNTENDEITLKILKSQK